MEVVELQPIAMALLSETVDDGKYERGVEDGRQIEHGRFWDAFQGNGKRMDYTYAFAHGGWTKDNFAPKYTIRPTLANTMFYKNADANFSLPEALQSCGVQLDFSKTTNMQYCFNLSALTEIGVVDVRNASNFSQAFSDTANLKKIEKLIDNSSQTFSNVFRNASALEEIKIEGVIGQNGFNVNTSPYLTHDSLMSIINALQSGVASRTCTLGVTNLAKLTDAEKVIATQKGWTLA